MVEMKDALIRAYRKYFGSPTAAEDHAAGTWTVMDGTSAVALCEMAIGEALVSGERARPDEDEMLNAFGRPVVRMNAEGPRGILASAIGVAMAGRRTAAFVDGTGVPAGQDLLYSAAGRHLPLAFHLTTTVAPGNGAATGGTHESFQLAAESGCFTLFARNVQEAVDFSFIARRVTEQTLVPAVVAMDANETAGAMQTVHLLSTPQIREFVGDPDEMIAVPTPSQKLLFGDTRRRIPRWYDTDRPVLHGAAHKGNGYALGTLGREVFFENLLPESLSASFEHFEALTGRRYDTVSDYRTGDASIVFVAQGSAVETLEAAANYLRENVRTKVGVLGLNVMRPLPQATIAKLLAGKKSVVVFEKSLPAAGSDGALTKEIRLALQGASGAPLIHSVIYGIGGLPFRLADIPLIMSRLNDKGPSRFALGVEFAKQDRRHPKRQVLLDELARAYPGIEAVGLREDEQVLIPSEEDTLAIAVRARVDTGITDLATNIGETLYKVEGGEIRGRTSHDRATWAHDQLSYLVHNPEALRDPGDEAPVDVLVLGPCATPVGPGLARRMRDRGVVVLIDVPDAAASRALTREFLEEAEKRELSFFGASRDDADIETIEFASGAVFAAIVHSGKKPLKRRRLMAARPESARGAFEVGYERCTILDTAKLIAGEASASSSWDKEAPAVVRALGRGDDQFDSLPRFWDQVGVLYSDDEADELTVDPYFATGTMAPLSATFRDLSGTRSDIPIFDATVCTACGRCWSTCPEGAVGAVSISSAALLETGMRAGGGEALRQVAGQLATRMTAQARKGELACHAGDAIRTEFAWLKEKMSLTPERTEALSEAVGKVATAVEQLPLAVAQPLFSAAEQVQKDSGELLSLAINPDVCKGCGICVNQCEPGALTMVDQTGEILEAARGLWDMWAATPDTPASTIERLMEDGSMDPMASLNLSRYCLDAMTGGDSAEAGSGEKIALRMVLSATEFYRQPILNRMANDAKQASEKLTQHIKEILASALPGDDLDALERTLDQVRSPLLTLSALAQQIESDSEGRELELAELRRLTRLAEDLMDLQHRIVEGAQGLGRARFGLAIAPGTVADWAGEFPWNPFQQPSVIDMTGDAVQMAAGLLQGHMRDTCEASALLRRATMEVDQPAGVDFELAAVDRIRWESLTDEEKRTCPPLIVVGTDSVLAGSGMSQVLWLLRSTLPIKIVCLSDLDSANDVAMLSLSVRGAYVANTSIGDPAHLHASVDAAMAWSGPALIQIHTPSPLRHGFSAGTTVSQALLASQSRAHPLFTYDPRIDGVHGTRICLDGNPDVALSWPVIDDQTLTPVHWAFTEGRFRDQFTPMPEQDTGVDPIDYLALDPAARQGKTPVLTVDDPEAGSIRYAIGPEVMRIMETAGETWQVLQELSGIVTPFTERIREAARQEVAETHAAELEALKAEYEEKIAGLTDNVQNEVAGRIRAQLLRLVKTGESHGQH